MSDVSDVSDVSDASGVSDEPNVPDVSHVPDVSDAKMHIHISILEKGTEGLGVKREKDLSQMDFKLNKNVCWRNQDM